MRVLVTRPQEDSEESARRLAARGHEALVAPLLQIKFRDGAPLTLEGIQAVLVTSANGVRALARRTARRDVPVFAVGPQSFRVAEAEGFATVHNANGDSRTLAAAASEWACPSKGALLYIRGEHTAGALADDLRARGFTVAPIILYSVTALKLTAEAASAMRQGTLDAAAFFSPRTARVFRDCILKEGLPTQGLMAVCISAAAEAALAPLSFASIRVAAAPNQDALFDRLG